MFMANIPVQYILPRELEHWHLQDHAATSDLMLCEPILSMSKRYSLHTAGIPLVFLKAENSFGCAACARSDRQHASCRQTGNFSLSILGFAPQLSLGNDAPMSATQGFFTETFNAVEGYQNYLNCLLWRQLWGKASKNCFFHHDQCQRSSHTKPLHWVCCCLLMWLVLKRSESSSMFSTFFLPMTFTYVHALLLILWAESATLYTQLCLKRRMKFRAELCFWPLSLEESESLVVYWCFLKTTAEFQHKAVLVKPG